MVINISDKHDKYILIGLSCIGLGVMLIALYRQNEIYNCVCRGEAEVSGVVKIDGKVSPELTIEFSGMGRTFDTETFDDGSYHTHLDVLGRTPYTVIIRLPDGRVYTDVISVFKGERKEFNIEV